MSDLLQLLDELTLTRQENGCDEQSVWVDPADLMHILHTLKHDPRSHMDMLIDLTAIDYLTYGQSDWLTQQATEQGFSRGRGDMAYTSQTDDRFVMVYHLLSLKHNHRLRVLCPLKAGCVEVNSVVAIWPNANWYEREVFDLFGILFHDHPDARRLLTDYGFIGHPFRKDFELSGYTEIRYDATKQACLYEPTSIEPRVNNPRVIRERPNEQ